MYVKGSFSSPLTTYRSVGLSGCSGPPNSTIIDIHPEVLLPLSLRKTLLKKPPLSACSSDRVELSLSQAHVVVCSLPSRTRLKTIRWGLLIVNERGDFACRVGRIGRENFEILWLFLLSTWVFALRVGFEAHATMIRIARVCEEPSQK